MNTSTPFFRSGAAPALFPAWFTVMFGLAVVSANQLVSAEDNSPGRLDPSFELHVQRDRVETIVMQPDGRLLVGGQFRIEGVGTNLVRFMPDGTPDPSFVSAASISRDVTKLALQPDGKILVGNKGGVDGTYPSIGLTRYLPDGRADASFRFRLPPNTSPRGMWSGFWTTALTVQPDGKILLAGYYERDHFDYWYWSSATLQKMESDGSDGQFLTFPWSVPQYIGVLVLLPDQRLLVGGDQMDRLNADGTKDAEFIRTILPSPGFAARTGIECCITQPDGKILIGGNFTNIQGHARCRIARLMSDGRLDLSFNPPVSTQSGDPYYTAIRALALQVDGRLLVGGNFETMNGLPYLALARLNSDGTLDTTFPPVLRPNEDQDIVSVNNIVIQNDHRAIIGGQDPTFGAWDLFRTYLGEPPFRLSIQQVMPGTVHLSFSYAGTNSLTVLRTSNLSFPVSEWTVLGSATRIGAGMYQFIDRVENSDSQRYYRGRRELGP